MKSYEATINSNLCQYFLLKKKKKFQYYKFIKENLNEPHYFGRLLYMILLSLISFI